MSSRRVVLSALLAALAVAGCSAPSDPPDAAPTSVTRTASPTADTRDRVLKICTDVFDVFDDAETAAASADLTAYIAASYQDTRDPAAAASHKAALQNRLRDWATKIRSHAALVPGDRPAVRAGLDQAAAIFTQMTDDAFLASLVTYNAPWMQTWQKALDAISKGCTGG